jgi:putative transposase
MAWRIFKTINLSGFENLTGFKVKPMQKIEPFTYDCFYHIYNRGINGCDVFSESENYSYFLKLFDQHVSAITDTYAWALMPNHFHFLIRVKSNLTGFQNLSGLIQKPPHQYLSNLFNAYTKAYNKRYDRHGALFERPFKRKSVQSLKYLQKLVLYIHNNPVHHGFCDDPVKYEWSSYQTCISGKPTRLKRQEVIDWFEDRENFIYMHKQKSDNAEIEEWLKT